MRIVLLRTDGVQKEAWLSPYTTVHELLVQHTPAEIRKSGKAGVALFAGAEFTNSTI